MNVDDDGPLALEFRGRVVQKAGNLFSVKALPTHKLRIDELRRIEAAGFAGGPTVELVRFDIDRVNIGRTLSRGDHETQVTAVVVPLDFGDHATRHTHVLIRHRKSSFLRAELGDCVRLSYTRDLVVGRVEHM